GGPGARGRPGLFVPPSALVRAGSVPHWSERGTPSGHQRARARGGPPMKKGFRVVHLVVVCFILAGIIVQPFLIGLFLFGAVHNSDLHTVVGYTLLEFGVPLLLLATLLA